MSTGGHGGGGALGGGRGPFGAWRGLFARGDHAEKEQLKHTDKAPKDAAITDPTSNAIQQKEQLKMALKAFRFTQAKDKPFVLVREDKHEIQDKRPMHGAAGKHADGKGDSSTPKHSDGKSSKAASKAANDGDRPHKSARAGDSVETKRSEGTEKQRIGDTQSHDKTLSKAHPQHEKLAMKALRFTRDPGNAFKIDMGGGKEVGDQRPINKSSGEVRKNAAAGEQGAKQAPHSRAEPRSRAERHAKPDNAKPQARHEQPAKAEHSQQQRTEQPQQRAEQPPTRRASPGTHRAFAATCRASPATHRAFAATHRASATT